MRAFIPLATLMLVTATLTGCGSPEDSKVTETRMDDVDSVEGTISDDMLNTDESTEEGPIDATPLPTDSKAVSKSDMKPVREPQAEKAETPTPAAATPKANADGE